MKSGTVLSAVGAGGRVWALGVWLGGGAPAPRWAGGGGGAVTAGGGGAGAPVRSAAPAGPTLRAASRTTAAAIIDPNRFLRIVFSSGERIQHGRFRTRLLAFQPESKASIGKVLQALAGGTWHRADDVRS